MPVANPVISLNDGVLAPVAVVFKNTPTVSEPAFATIASGLPSPFTSATVSRRGALPVANGL
jgi:hypothetical protein